MEVENLLTERNIPFMTQGSDLVVKCLNPEHEDSHPSMRIDRITGVFHCFSCKYKGNVFTLFGKNVSEIEQRTLKIKQKIVDMQKPTKIELPSDAKLFNKDFRGITAETLNSFNAFSTFEDEDMRDRIVFPIYNLSGEPIAMIGRFVHSDAKPKYLIRPNKVKLPLFPALPKPLNGSIILVEGIFDALNLIDKGLPNAVACLGTSTLSERSFDRLFSYIKVLGVHTVYTMFDNDDAGELATKQTAKLLKSKGFYTDNIEIPGDYNDPGDFPLNIVQALREWFDESSNSRESTH